MIYVFVFHLLLPFIQHNEYNFDLWQLNLIRYFKRELLEKGAIDLEKLPKHFAAWIQKGSDQCIYTPQQLKKFKPQHLDAGCQYLDCICGFVIESEAEVKSQLDGGSATVEDLGDSSDEAEGLQDQSLASPPKRGRGRRLRPLGSKTQGSQDTGAESSAPGKGAAVTSPS